ncbi:hypothetical protein [Rhizobium herbae]
MNLYRWTLVAKGRQPIGRISTLEEFRKVLRILNLPGSGPAEFTSTDAEIPDHGLFSHNEGGPMNGP